MSRLRRRPNLILTVLGALVALGGLSATPASAQTDSWSFLLTPQVWVSHIDKNGLVPPGTFAGVEPFAGPDGRFIPNLFTARNSEPVDSLNPQWGLQVAAQKGRWSLAAGFQYVSFETRTDLFYTPSNGLPASPNPQLFPCPHPLCVSAGQRVAQEFVNTTRMDIDLAASYLFPDVVPDTLDFSTGVGLKFIYASASRNYANLSPFAASIGGAFPPGLYEVCERDDCHDQGFRDRVKTKSWLYGVTFPTSVSYHLTSDARWLLPFSVTPFIGAETRDDRDVVYALSYPGDLRPVNDPPLFGARVNRLDGTTFAYGVTGDVTLRWILTDNVSTYAGMRVQYIKGHETYLAYGPLFGMSVRFGGK